MRKAPAAAWAALCVLLTAAPAGAEGLGPENVLVVVNQGDPASRRVADHYMRARSIPDENRLNVALPAEPDIARGVYNRNLRNRIRDYLEKRGLRERIRCIVLSYGLPLRVRGGGGKPDADERPGPLSARWRRTLNQIDAELEKLSHIAEDGEAADAGGDSEDRDQGTEEKRPSEPSLKAAGAAAGRVNAALGRALARVKALPEERRAAAEAELLRRRVALTGTIGSWDALREKIVADAPPGRLREVYEQLQGAALAVEALRLHGGRDARSAVRRLRSRHYGLLGLLQQHALDRHAVKVGATASLDSELSLLWWEDYPLRGRVRNVAAYPLQRVRGVYPEGRVLITARLHAADAETAIRMIDDAVATERSGLRGRFYIDAQGIRGEEGKGAFDLGLVDLAERIRQANRGGGENPVRVVLDEKKKIMPPHSGKNAALYCGWYALRDFNDPLEFTTGAVGYHVASFEAADFSASSSDWAPNLLRVGCAATLGPVAEPYLDAFPPPGDFFPLLMTGRHTVGEVFLATKKYNSWMMVLCGDPLYNPFKNAPALTRRRITPTRAIRPEPPEGAMKIARRLVREAVGGADE